MAHKNSSNWSPYTARKKDPGAAPGAGARPGSVTQSKHGKHRRPSATESYDFNEADDRIYAIFRNHDFGDYPHAKRQQLTRFFQLLMANQRENNFTRLLTLRDTAIKHFIDCLIVTRFVDLQFPLMDVGTGPGFPGIPLKIHFPESKIILAEGVQKRVEFLKSLRLELGLKNLPIIGRNINSDVFYPCRGVITRAVEDAGNTLGNIVNSLQAGGYVYLMKGPNCSPEIQPALDKWGEYFTLQKDVAYELPKSPHERRLLVFKKIKSPPLPDFESMDDAWEREHGNEGE